MDHTHSESHPHVAYWMVFGALCICTLISWVLDIAHLPKSFLVVAVLAVAVAKALFVMTYFMHLKFEGRWKFIILMPTAILGVGLMIALAPDIALHYYDYDVMQAHEIGHGGSHGDAHGEETADDHGDGGHDDHGHADH